MFQNQMTLEHFLVLIKKSSTLYWNLLITSFHTNQLMVDMRTYRSG